MTSVPGSTVEEGAKQLERTSTYDTRYGSPEELLGIDESMCAEVAVVDPLVDVVAFETVGVVIVEDKLDVRDCVAFTVVCNNCLVLVTRESHGTT